MKSKNKSMLLMFLILSIGVVIGILGSGLIRDARWEHLRQRHPEDHFTNIMEEIIRPDASQKAAIEDILAEYAEKIAAVQQKRAAELIALYDSSRAEMEALLSEAQKKRLQAHFKKVHKKINKIYLERLSRMLDLTKDQQREVRAMFHPTDREFSGEDFRPAARSREWKNKRKQIDKKLEQILTPEQWKKYKNFHNQRGRPFDHPFFHQMDSLKF